MSDVELIRCFMSFHPGLGRLGLLLVFLVLFWVQFSVAVSNGIDLGFSQNLVSSSVLHMHPHEPFFLSDGHKSGYFHNCPLGALYLNFCILVPDLFMF